MSALDLVPAERGDDEAWVGFALRPFRLADDTTATAPALACRVLEVLEAARRLAGLPALRLGPGHMPLDLLGQPLVARQTEHEVHDVGLAPRHQPFAGEARISAHQDANPGPLRPDPADDPVQFPFGTS